MNGPEAETDAVAVYRSAVCSGSRARSSRVMVRESSAAVIRCYDTRDLLTVVIDHPHVGQRSRISDHRDRGHRIDAMRPGGGVILTAAGEVGAGSGNSFRSCAHFPRHGVSDPASPPSTANTTSAAAKPYRTQLRRGSR